MNQILLIGLFYCLAPAGGRVSPAGTTVGLPNDHPSATWTNTELTLNYDTVQRIIKLPAADGSFLTTSYKPVNGEFQYFQKTSPDFQFTANDSVYAGSGSWRLVTIGKITDAKQGDGAAVTLQSKNGLAETRTDGDEAGCIPAKAAGTA